MVCKVLLGTFGSGELGQCCLLLQVCDISERTPEDSSVHKQQGSLQMVALACCSHIVFLVRRGLQ